MTMTDSSPSQQERKVVLQVQHLKKYFPVKRGLLQSTRAYVKAVDDISFEIY
jgi:peptide/nickel transport system ATP-binding protein/oligopeptide transport system ATP-binding protein